ncbi:MAG: peroxiredoxin [Nitrososphaerales archaeon]
MLTDDDPYNLPEELPAPKDDGACCHLVGLSVPSIILQSTSGKSVNVSEVSVRRTLFYFYPGTIKPGIPIPAEWNSTPGARGCTLQTCGFKDNYQAFQSLGCQVFGVSGQGQEDPGRGLEEQIELANRLKIPFELLNDSRFELVRALNLPTFKVELRSPEFEFKGRMSKFVLQGRTLVKRLAFIANYGKIEKVFYPIFPPDQNAADSLEYLQRSRLIP